MAKSELFWFPLSAVISRAGAFKVHRGQADREAIETAVELARDGNVIAMFPEGTRRQEGPAEEVRGGGAHGRRADRARGGVPLVPAGIKGTDGLSHFAAWRVRYGTPIELDDLRDREMSRRGARARPTG